MLNAFFSGVAHCALMSAKGKTCITIYFDSAVLGAFRERVKNAGTGYQRMINDAPEAYLST